VAEETVVFSMVKNAKLYYKLKVHHLLHVYWIICFSGHEISVFSSKQMLSVAVRGCRFCHCHGDKL